jgi:hypothetical protein
VVATEGVGGASGGAVVGDGRGGMQLAALEAE